VTDDHPGPKSDIAATLGLGGRDAGQPRSARRAAGIVVGVLALLLIVAVARRDGGSVRYVTEPVVRGDLVVEVSATGTLEPRRKVDVGSELSGTIRTVEADFNDRVAAGQVLARMDTTRLDAQVAQAEASLRAAHARLEVSRATVREAAAQAGRLQKLHALSNGETPAQSELDAVTAALDRARADEASSEAAIAQWEATLAAYRTDRAKMDIRSPIDGMVLRRTVQPGQTVAATFQAPVLFTLAEDLARLDLVIDVDEADIGKVKERQAATFTVDAFPDRAFDAKISQVRYGSQALDGVVTYKTVLEVDNADLTLRPGMTATASIHIEKHARALLVPNAALRFAPPSSERASRRGGLMGSMLPVPPPVDQRPAAQAGRGSGVQRVHVLAGGRPQPVAVTVGWSDGSMTEVTAGDLAEGAAVITDAQVER
jgi:HlyD family secretion protein